MTASPTGEPLEVVRRYIDAVNRHDIEAVSEVASDAVVLAIEWFIAGNPDLHFEVDWIAGHDRKVTAWIYGTGTHTGDWTLPPAAGSHAFEALPPTGRTWRVACSVTYLIEANKIADFWVAWDFLSLLDQLGVIEYRTVSPSA